MPVPKTGALPLGDTLLALVYYTAQGLNAQAVCAPTFIKVVMSIGG